MNIQIDNQCVNRIIKALNVIKNGTRNTLKNVSVCKLPFEFDKIIGILDICKLHDISTISIPSNDHPGVDVIGTFEIDYDQSILKNKPIKQFTIGNNMGSQVNADLWLGFINKSNGKFINIGNNERFIKINHTVLTTCYVPVENMRNYLDKWEPIVIATTVNLDFYPIVVHDSENDKLVIIDPTKNPNLPFMEIIDVIKYVDISYNSFKPGAVTFTSDDNNKFYRRVKYYFYRDKIFHGTITIKKDDK